MEHSFDHWHYPKPIRAFFADRARSAKTSVETSKNFRQQHVANGSPKRDADWIMRQSGLPWMPLDLAFPAKQMLEEARRLRAHFVTHRGDETQREYLGKGWRALTLHGLSSTQTRDAHKYSSVPDEVKANAAPGANHPYARAEEEAPYHWTEASKLCPVTTAWLKKTLPHGSYLRVRFMVLEPGAFLMPHMDRHYPELSEMYASLNQPKGAYLKVDGFGYVPQKTGSLQMLDVHKTHSVINASDEERYNIVIIGKHDKNKKWRSLIETGYAKFMSGRIN